MSCGNDSIDGGVVNSATLNNPTIQGGTASGLTLSNGVQVDNLTALSLANALCEYLESCVLSHVNGATLTGVTLKDVTLDDEAIQNILSKLNEVVVDNVTVGSKLTLSDDALTQFKSVLYAKLQDDINANVKQLTGIDIEKAKISTSTFDEATLQTIYAGISSLIMVSVNELIDSIKKFTGITLDNAIISNTQFDSQTVANMYAGIKTNVEEAIANGIKSIDELNKIDLNKATINQATFDAESLSQIFNGISDKLASFVSDKISCLLGSLFSDGAVIDVSKSGAREITVSTRGLDGQKTTKTIAFDSELTFPVIQSITSDGKGVLTVLVRNADGVTATTTIDVGVSDKDRGVTGLNFNATTKKVTWVDNGVDKEFDLSSFINQVSWGSTTTISPVSDGVISTKVIGDKDISMGGPKQFREITFPDGFVGKIALW